MSMVERLQRIAKERGTNFKQIEQKCGIGNGTMRRWDVQTPRLDKIKAVADYLNVSIDYLVYGSSVSATPPAESTKVDIVLTCDDVPLSKNELDLLAMYRLLPPDHQEDTFELVYSKYQRYVEKKKGSIYSTYCDETPDAEDCAGSHDGGAALA